MRLGSVCSGVGGMDRGLEAAGFSLAWLCERDGQASSVLRYRFPGVPIYDNLEGLADRDGLEPVQLLAGGTPCQDLSVAGRRAGLDGERSGLFFEFIRLADRLAPDWLLWENVDGALSSSKGEDFAVCLEGFTGFRPAVPQEGWRSSGVCVGPLRWCVWRVLDAQWFGVAQRRARVFVVAGTGSEPRPEVLLEPESVSGDSAPSRTQGEGVAGVIDESLARPLGAGSAIGKSYRVDLDHGAFVPMVAPALTSKMAKGTGGPSGDEAQNLVAHTLTGNGHDASEDGTGRGTPIVLAKTLGVRSANGSNARGDGSENIILAPTLRCGGREQGAGSSYDNTPVIAQSLAIRNAPLTPSGGRAGIGIGAVLAVVPRRLTPRECERLMSWEDDWTKYGIDAKDRTVELADSPRYRCIGNGVVSNVAEWIARRILAVAA
jgi:DNA (cytosine-5)-methyltransferase 1